jgi:hypothetical protein
MHTLFRTIAFIPLITLLSLVAVIHSPAQAVPDRFEDPTKRREREDHERKIKLERDLEERKRKMDDLASQTGPGKMNGTRNPAYVSGSGVSAEDLNKYSKFLEQPDSGIFRIYSNPGCKGIDCKPLPAARSDYSFVNRGYVLRPFHEIGEYQGSLFSDGLFSQGIFVMLGDLPIENVDPTHLALKFLTEFKVSSDLESARNARKEFSVGMDSNGYRYSNRVPAQVNMTYAARIIQYKFTQTFPIPAQSGSALQALLVSANYDARADIIVIFRIIRIDTESGYTTIVFNELRKTTAPEMPVPSDIQLTNW